jgi:tRNA pseudouridine32 synthase/23S rRNA pseudouridine746 synthase
MSHAERIRPVLTVIKIIFQNDDFALIDKPAEMLSVPSRLGAADPRPVAGILLQDQLRKRIFPVHRLDEAVSGLLLFALSPDAQRSGNQWFEQHQIIKTYAALTRAAVPQELRQQTGPEWHVWSCKLAKGKKRAFEAPHGKSAVTRYQLMALPDAAPSIWHLQPVTGRSHQLRFEMARHGMPIDGDTLYGSRFPSSSGSGIDLRAFELDLRACPNRHVYGMPDIFKID